MTDEIQKRKTKGYKVNSKFWAGATGRMVLPSTKTRKAMGGAGFGGQQEFGAC